MIALAVRWYGRYRLSYTDVVAWLAERGSTVDRSTSYRWGQRFLPRFTEAARAHRRSGGEQWRVAETSCRVHGKWVDIDRAIDQAGQISAAAVSARRTAAAG